MLIAYLLTKSITVPLSTLNDVVIETGKHGPYATVNVTSDDEIGQLASSFKAMNDDLRDYREKLKATNSILQSTVESTADGILVVDTKGGVTCYNRKFADMWHIPESLLAIRDDEQLLSHVLAQLSEPERFLEEVKNLYATPERKSFDVLSFKNGRVFERYSQPQMIEGNVVGRVWSFRDVTRRREIELALKESEIKYRQIVELPHAGIWVIDRGAYTTYVNPKMAAMLGYDVNEMQGKHLFTFMDENGVEICKNSLQRREEGITERHDFEFIKKDGNRIYVAMETSPVFDDNGNYGGAIAGVVDISDRNKLEKQLRRELSVNKIMTEVSGELIKPLSMTGIANIISHYAKELTNSKYANASYIDQLTGHLIATAVSKEVWDQCHVGNQSLVFREFTGLWGWVLKNKKSLMTNTPTEDPRYKGVPEGHVPIERFLSVPAIIDDTAVGQISVINPDKDYTEEDLIVAERLAALFALAIHRSHTEDAINRELTFQSSVSKIAEALLDPKLDKYDISRIVHEEALRLTESSHGYVSIIDEATGDNIAVNLTDMIDGECRIARENQRISFPRSPEGYNALWGYCLNTREGFYTNSPKDHSAFKGCIPEGHVSLQRFLSVPAISGDRLIGQISLANPPKDYNDKDLEIITRLAVIYSIAIERKLMEEQLEKRVEEEAARRQQNEQLLIQQSKMAAMGEMIGLIAHQWKQPLNAISLIAQDLGDAYAYNELDKDYLHNSQTRILQQIQFMSRTIDDFRNFLRPSKEKVAFDLKEAIEEIVSILSPLLLKSNIRLNLSCANDMANINVTGYPNEFKQVILNLISNARDAIAARVTTESKTQQEIQIGIFKESGKTVISIRDSGGGIPDDIFGRIFEPYFTTKSSDDGTGIGLYMAKTIIETNMNWKLSVRNIDNGAEFRIEI
ncbi:MAG: GAF domain-containing protein [Nitrospirae bacterium]|nr:GAF domain-containing protein [Nitrospirota bacterium]